MKLSEFFYLVVFHIDSIQYWKVLDPQQKYNPNNKLASLLREALSIGEYNYAIRAYVMQGMHIVCI